MALEEFEPASQLLRKASDALRVSFSDDPSESSLNGVLWIAHLEASCLLKLRRPEEALELLRPLASEADLLEKGCRSDRNLLDTCAAFWESTAEAEASLGEGERAKEHSARGSSLRARIATLKRGVR